MWLLLLKLIIALPSLYSMIKEIWNLIRDLPKDEQPEARAKLVELAKAMKESKLKGTQSCDMTQFKDELLERLGRKPS